MSPTAESPGSAPSKRAGSRTARKRQEILEAAIQAFRDEGYETTSMDRIAEVAGASKRTVYNHFSSKERLFEAVVERLHSRVVELKQIDWDPKRSVEDQLREFARAKTLLAEDPNWLGLVRVVLGVFIRDPQMARRTMERASEGENSLVRWLKAAHAAGCLRVTRPARAADLFWSMVSGALFWPQVMEGPMNAKTRTQVTKDVIDTFVCRYRAGD